MHKRLHISITILFLIISSHVYSQIDLFKEQSQFILTNYVNNGLVDYKNLDEDKEALYILKESLEKTNINDLSPQELKAFLINAYNMTVIISIIDNYPTSSVMKVDGFFNKNKHNIGGELMTLNYLEKKWLYKKFPDTRLHFALVCGAISCPPLSNTLFTSQNTESKLEQLTKKTLNNSRFIEIDMHEKSVTASQLFNWYSSDFEKNGTVIDYINSFSDKKIPDGFILNFKIYNWNLNTK